MEGQAFILARRGLKVHLACDFEQRHSPKKHGSPCSPRVKEKGSRLFRALLGFHINCREGRLAFEYTEGWWCSYESPGNDNKPLEGSGELSKNEKRTEHVLIFKD